jgi:hypothetical protein
MGELRFSTAFDLGSYVCLSTDPGRFMGRVIAIKKCWNGGIYYEVTFANEADWYQSLELDLHEADPKYEPPKDEDPLEAKKKKKKPPMIDDLDDEGNEGDILK